MMLERSRPALAVIAMTATTAGAGATGLGREVAVERHLTEGEEYALSARELVEHGRRLFDARWTSQEGAGRPLTTGTGQPLADPSAPLVFPNNFNRLSGPDANSCAGCHNQPRSGGAGDNVANVFVLGQRFDFVTFDPGDFVPGRGTLDERGFVTTLRDIANERGTVHMFGAGYIEMLARRITAELQSQRDALGPGEAVMLQAKGVEFGELRRRPDGTWDTSAITALPSPGLATGDGDEPPSLVVRPFHQAGAVVSLRQFSNNAFNHHHGIQSTERFGYGDPDGDGHTAEMTRADVTAVSVFQATLAVPGRVIPRDPVIEEAVRTGERVFVDIGCADCHVPKLELEERGWLFSEPNPYNPPGNLRPEDAEPVTVDLNSPYLDPPRLRRQGRTVAVPAYTDFRLHDVTRGPGDPGCEPLDMQFPPGTPEFFAGNCRFLTARLWGVASTAPYMHHGKATTMREAIELHHGAAEASRERWLGRTDYERDAVIEFLKTLQILPEGTRHRVVDERFRPRLWPSEETGRGRRHGPPPWAGLTPLRESFD